MGACCIRAGQIPRRIPLPARENLAPLDDLDAGPSFSKPGQRSMAVIEVKLVWRTRTAQDGSTVVGFGEIDGGPIPRSRGPDRCFGVARTSDTRQRLYQRFMLSEGRRSSVRQPVLVETTA
jgi:hypothetical protein